MSERRCFSKLIIDCDLFLDMPLSAQLLYFHLGMNADDEGFVNNPHKIQRSVGCSDVDLEQLKEKQFVIPFSSGVIVITHWNVHNSLRKDRIKATMCQQEREQLSIDETGTYVFNADVCQPNDNQVSTNCQTTDGQMTVNCPPKVREDKIRKSKGGEEESNAAEAAAPPSPSKPAIVRHKFGEYKNVLLSDEELDKLKKELPNSYEGYIERLSTYIASKGAKYKNHLATIRNWARRDREEAQNKDKHPVKDYDRDILEVLNETTY